VWDAAEFVVAFAAISRKVCSSFYLFLCPHGTTPLPLDGNLMLGIFSKICGEKLKFSSHPTRITDTSHEDVFTLMVKSCCIIIKLTSVPDKAFIGIQNTHFMFNTFFPKIVPFMRQCRKIWRCQTGHKRQYTEHALCILDN
jgi:hypothetical protein